MWGQKHVIYMLMERATQATGAGEATHMKWKELIEKNCCVWELMTVNQQELRSAIHAAKVASYLEVGLIDMDDAPDPCICLLIKNLLVMMLTLECKNKREFCQKYLNW